MATPITWVPFDDRIKAKINRGVHNFSGKMRRLPWPYCTRCGLLLLKNDASREAARKPCEILEDE